MRQGWLTVRNQDQEGVEILIDGFIGDSWDDKSTTYSAGFRSALNSVPKGMRVTVGLNSGGGAIDDGISIFNAIRDRGDVTVRVDGYALSIASLILQAGSRRIVPKSAMVMEHKPWSGSIGDADDHRQSADILDKHADMIADVVGERTRREKSAVLEAMAKESWYTGAEAVAMGFADEASDKPVTFSKFDASKFSKVPKALAAYAVQDFPAALSQEKPADVGGSTTDKHKEDMKTLMGILATCGLVASADTTDEQAAAQVTAWINKNKADGEAAKASLETETKAHEATRAAFAEAVVDRAVEAGKIEDKPETRAAWAKAHIADRATAGAQLASIRVRPVNAELGHPNTDLPGGKRIEEPAKTGLDRVVAAFTKRN